jgi:hypothetical protein
LDFEVEPVRQFGELRVWCVVWQLMPLRCMCESGCLPRSIISREERQLRTAIRAFAALTRRVAV